ncbi:hypothetical protein D7294_13240 [Streptomyces hoynatensis]|uniref:Uncharacterized protein n=1 Tax=Streptomyces hoynatensis TaxID=1141874 RepID=A0A3A9Z2X8_9ACTN|nr:hypothetical protein D7294_13240 [Streptomyces hoynatensis]
MDAALALVSVAAGSAATEAGRRAWDSLVALSRRLLGRAEAGTNEEAGSHGGPGTNEAAGVGEGAGPGAPGPAAGTAGAFGSFGSGETAGAAAGEPAAPASAGPEPPATPLAPVAPQDERAVRAFAALLAERARGDAGFAAELIRWGEAHRAALGAAGRAGSVTVHNTVSGNARIEGGLIQAGDITGDITFGS